MAKLTKLKIGGVRSFGGDDDDYQYLYFESPFNLILGRNGCGKTTIIESLKYACTGTLPAGQGTNYVRDPKMDSRIETRGQVKLNYVSCQGKESTITRNMSLSQKVKTQVFKTLDTTAEVKEKDGTIKHLSGRCADMDELMTHSLGVSKPILNYVIFCHQEEAHWPLDEGRKVKEKFDEIFDSTKYNKCMAEVRRIRKDLMTEIRVNKEGLKFLEGDVTFVIQKRGELELLTQRFKKNEEKIKEHEKQISEYDDEYNIWFKKYKDYEKLKAEKEMAQNGLHNLIHEQETQRKYISVEFTGTEDELQKAIKDFDGQLEAKKEAIEFNKKNIQELENLESTIYKKTLQLQKIIGKLESDKLLEQKTTAQRNEKLSNLAKAFGQSALANNATESEVSNLFLTLKRELDLLASSVSTLKLKQQNEQSALQENINKCLLNKTKIESELGMKEDSIKSNKNEIRALTVKLSDVNEHLLKKEQIDKELEKCRENHVKAVEAEDSEVLSETVEDLRQLCGRLEERQKQLSAEMVKLFKYQDALKDLKNSEVKYKEVQATIRRLRSKNDDFISEHLKNSSDDSIKCDLEGIIHKLKREVDQLKSQLLEKNQEAASLDQDRKHKKALLEKKQNELGEKKESIFKLCGKKKLSEILDGVQTEIEGIQTNRAMFSASKLVFTRFIKQLEKNDPCCPLCHRNFENALYPMELIDELNSSIKTAPTQVEEQSEKLSKLQNKQRNLLKLEPVEKEVKNLEDTEIPNLQNDLGGIELVLDTILEEINGLEVSLKEPEGNLRLAESIQNDIFDIDRCQKESKQIARQTEILKRDLPLSSVSRTSEQALAEHRLIQDELSDKRHEKDDAEERQRVYLKNISDLDQQINKLVDQQHKIRELMQQEHGIKERLTELSSLSNVLMAEFDQLNQMMKSAKEKKKNAEEAFDAAREKHKQKLEILEKQKSEREMGMSGVLSLEESLSNLKSQNISQMLNEKKQSHKELVAESQELKVQKDKLSQDSNVLSDALKNHSQRKTELEGNLMLMKLAKQIKKQKETLKCAEEKLGGTDSRGLSNKLHQIEEEKSSVKSKVNELRGKQHGCQENIESRKQELNQGHLKNAEKKHKEKFVLLTIQQHSEKDLQKFYTAMDVAMQKFHKDRMNSVNEIIRELWRLIYRGNDIDFIEIKTDESSQSATQTSDKKRVYNYRVVQVKNGIEIDMRGRCSAGQKVLASLIIRMALAETFSANCGILTLDEPTTNLDKQNIRSLCYAIMNIVHEREANKNFQLIVITHDHDFLHMMSEMDFFSHYWDVSRNHMSKSLIRRMEVNKD